MKRRIFVKLAVATTASLYLPGLGCNSRDSSLKHVLSQPDELQHICDAETIRAIGKAYQKLAPKENTETLAKLLAANIHDQSSSPDQALVASILKKKVREDFLENRTIVVDGWVLSVTEARQCALFALTQN